MRKELSLVQLLLFLVTVGSAIASNDSVIITQVLYDPITSESGGEAIELYNPTPEAIDISGWVISTETSPTDVVFPSNTLISSGGYYLVADAGWSGSRDNASWPEADYEEAITLANTDAGVALSNGSHVIDAVGWGDALNIGNGLYEGSPHTGTSSGEALVRIKNNSSYLDSNNNSNDFITAIPDFHNSSFGNSYGSGEIGVVAVIWGSFPVINSLQILTDDDSSTEGRQVNPLPKGNRTVEVAAVVSHGNGNGYLQSVILSFGNGSVEMVPTFLNETSSLYTARFNMSYYAAPGNYTVNVSATDKAGLSANASSFFEYTSLIAMEIDTSSLQFGAMPGTASEIIGDYDSSTSTNTTIGNIGNSVFDIQLSGTNLSSGSSVIGVSNIQYTFNGDYNSSLAGNLSHEKQTKPVAIAAASKQPLSFKLNVPLATAQGNYTGTITLVAVKP